jgi:hypothetical protein
MSQKYFFILSFLLTFLTFQVIAQRSSEQPTKEIEKILGKWELQKVYAGGREIARNPNSGTHPWIEFKPDGTYEQNTEEIDHGSYRLNENQSTLYLESSDKKETSSITTVNNINEYAITIKDDVLIMQSKGPENSGTGTVKYVYAKNPGVEKKE